jgi:hypothetical protein
VDDLNEDKHTEAEDLLKDKQRFKDDDGNIAAAAILLEVAKNHGSLPANEQFKLRLLSAMKRANILLKKRLLALTTNNNNVGPSR